MEAERGVCGRIAQNELSEKRLRCQFILPELWHPRYNLAPTQDAVVLRQPGAEITADLMRWGLVPARAADTINARAETVHELPTYAEAFARRRAIVPVNATYEWSGKGAHRQTWAYLPAEGEVFALAGLWQRWPTPDEPDRLTFTVITTQASPATAAVHHRMPALLHPDEWEAWLDPRRGDAARLLPLLRPWTGPLQLRRVSPYVNNVRHDGPQCLEPMPAPLTLFD